MWLICGSLATFKTWMTASDCCLCLQRPPMAAVASLSAGLRPGQGHVRPNGVAASQHAVVAVQLTTKPRQAAGSSGKGPSRWPQRTRPPGLVRAQQQQQQQEQEAVQEAPDLSLEDLRAPKFQPFVPQNALQRAMLSYRFWQECPEGTLLVLPLTADWVPATADLLTDSFAESMSATRFTNYLRRQVKAYLEAHMKLPPKAVVLVALLLPPASQPYQADADCSSSSSSSGGVLIAGSDGLAAAKTAAADTNSSGGTMGSHAGGGRAEQLQQQQDLGLGTPLSLQEGWELGDGMAMNPLLSSSMSSDGSSSGDDGVETASMSALGGFRDEIQQQQQQEAEAGDGPPAEPSSATGPGSGAVLVGVVELSFSASTRSKYMTLNPPEEHCYCCNMATHPDHRGKGYGLLVMQAAEQLVASLGETDIYLHLRVQDTPAARLYAKAGFEEVAADSILVRLLGLDQRRLLRKKLARQQQRDWLAS